MIARPLNRRILEPSFGDFAAECLGVFLDRATSSKLVLAAPVSFDLFADAVIKAQKIFVSQILDYHKSSPRNAPIYTFFLNSSPSVAQTGRSTGLCHG